MLLIGPTTDDDDDEKTEKSAQPCRVRREENMRVNERGTAGEASRRD